MSTKLQRDRFENTLRELDSYIFEMSIGSSISDNLVKSLVLYGQLLELMFQMKYEGDTFDILEPRMRKMQVFTSKIRYIA